ncbi:branched-chain amino acid transaminase [Pleionea sp. CnH1-48]|uniref:branched-chain amino acid transaminase n=1 Tax=Pleionea sp. CnH1-48 TaxID=2954494 RepID=UPI0020973BD0|nr:branched-chain amino acid transaminase [Pleionea sp. CnH1-48]MCO7227173.1 branched-chain amino acid transaminase [Pleionea sp. CnH1-48]
MAIKQPEFIWFNGKLIHWNDAKVHVLSHAIHYGSSVFEGIRCYETEDGLAIFRLQDHVKRLYDSAKIYRMEIPFSEEAMNRACRDVITENRLGAAYLRPIAFRGYSSIGVLPADNPVEVSVAAFEWGAYLGEESLAQGVDVGVSSWNRVAPNTIPTAAKAGGNYLSSQLVAEEAKRHGYAEGIALDTQGYISEGSGENIFIVRNGKLYTPPATAAILPGITRDTIMTLARELGYETIEANLAREALYLADEVFMTGTAAEIVPVRSVDSQIIGAGCRGPITEQLQKTFFGLFNGTTEDKWGWLDHIYLEQPMAVYGNG